MLKIEKEVKLTQTKFQQAKLYPLRNQQIFVSLQTNASSHMLESDMSLKKYLSQTYAFRSINEDFRKIKNLKIIDVAAEKIDQSQNQLGYGLFISDSSKQLQQYSKNIINFHKVNEGIKIARILNEEKYASFDYHRKNITVDFLKPLNSQQTKSKFHKKESNNIIYQIPANQEQNSILSLQKLDQTRLIFHIGQCRQDEQINKQLKCFDLVHQSVSWKYNLPRYFSMANKIVKISENTFMNGVADFNTSIVLKLFDLRVNGAVANMLSYQGEAVEALQGQWNRRGFLGLNFDFLLNNNSQFQFLGIIGISLGAYNFPYHFDLRRPEQIQPLGFPNGEYFKHLKALQICQQNLYAIEREYHNFSFKQCKLSRSHIAYD